MKKLMIVAVLAAGLVGSARSAPFADGERRLAAQTGGEVVDWNKSVSALVAARRDVVSGAAVQTSEEERKETNDERLKLP